MEYNGDIFGLSTLKKEATVKVLFTLDTNWFGFISENILSIYASTEYKTAFIYSLDSHQNRVYYMSIVTEYDSIWKLQIF